MTDTHAVSLLARKGLMREPRFLLSMLNKLLSCHEIRRKTATIAELQWEEKKKVVSKQKLSPVKGKVICRLEKYFVLRLDLLFI